MSANRQPLAGDDEHDEQEHHADPSFDAHLRQVADEDEGDLFERADDDDEGAEPGDETPPARATRATANRGESAPPADASDDDEADEEADDDADGSAHEAPPADARESEEHAGDPPPPFSFKADGVDVQVQGSALVDVDGVPHVVIPADSWQRHVQPHLRHQSVWQQREQEYRRQIRDLDPERNPAVIEARTIREKIVKLLESEDAFTEFVSDFQRNKDLLLRDARIAALEAQTQARRQDAEAEDATTLEASLRATLDQTVDSFLADAEYQGLDRELTLKRLWPLRATIFGRAQRDYPEYGIQKGEVVINYDRVREILEPDREYIRRLRPTREAGQKADDVAQRNERRLTRRKHFGPTVPAKGSPAASVRKDAAPASRDDWERDFARTLKDIAEE